MAKRNIGSEILQGIREIKRGEYGRVRKARYPREAIRKTLVDHEQLAEKLEEVEKKTVALALKYDALAAEIRSQFGQVAETLRYLMSKPTRMRRPIRLRTTYVRRSGQ